MAHPGRDVAVQIEGAAMGNLRAHHPADLLDQHGLARPDPFRVHCPVEPEKDAVDQHLSRRDFTIRAIASRQGRSSISPPPCGEGIRGAQR